MFFYPRGLTVPYRLAVIGSHALSHLSFTLGQDQETARLNLGVDMGKNRWVMDILDTVDGKHHRFNFTGCDLAQKAYEKVKELLGTGREVDVIYSFCRRWKWPVSRT